MDPQEQQTRMWAMILHFSQFAGYIVPYAGLVAPIVIWQLKKNELPGLDVHGKAVTNWIISMLIYSAVCAILVFLLIGIPMLILLAVVGLIYVIIGGIKASSGEVWSYPGSIKFFKNITLDYSIVQLSLRVHSTRRVYEQDTVLPRLPDGLCL